MTNPPFCNQFCATSQWENHSNQSHHKKISNKLLQLINWLFEIANLYIKNCNSPDIPFNHHPVFFFLSTLFVQRLWEASQYLVGWMEVVLVAWFPPASAGSSWPLPSLPPQLASPGAASPWILSTAQLHPCWQALHTPLLPPHHRKPQKGMGQK